MVLLNLSICSDLSVSFFISYSFFLFFSPWRCTNSLEFFYDHFPAFVKLFGYSRVQLEF